MPTLRLTTYFLVVLLPFEALRLPGGLPLVRSLGAICFIGFLLDVFQKRTSGQPVKIRFGNDIRLLFAFLAMAFVSVTYSDNPGAGLSLYTNIVSVMLLYIFVRATINNLTYLEHFLMFMCFGFVLSTVIAYLAGSGVVSVGSEAALDLRLQQSRFSGFLRNPNRFAYYALLVFWAAILLFSVVERRRLFSLVVMLFCTAMIIMSLSRGAIGGLLIGWLAFFFFSPGKSGGFGKFLMVSISILTVVLFGDFFVDLGPRFSRDTLQNSGSSLARLSLWASSIESISAHPVLGVGLGSLDGVTGEEGFSIHDPHNIFLFAMQFFGIPGIMLLLIAILGLGRKSIMIQTKKNNVGFLTLAFLLSIVIPGIFHTVLFWKPFILGLCLIVIVQRSIFWQTAEQNEFLVRDAVYSR